MSTKITELTKEQKARFPSDEIPNARYLKMLNPSIGVWHVEGVSPECQTVQHALNWRAGNISEDWKPSVLT